ncbi:hypothetical protein F5Y05DRAFT_252263 [Hypoxylon sp. FL0543]|nr:hypothetical protein F5Y05DRAFT_252263 [Hypoxylon sp. FL0543]
MPTFVTRETYTCSHNIETRLHSFGTDDGIIVETVPIPSQCLACLCESLLDSTFAFRCKDVGLSPDRISPPHAEELAKHLQALLAWKKRCVAAGVYGAGYGPELKVIRELEKLKCSVVAPIDLGEYREALLALAGGFPDFDIRSVL